MINKLISAEDAVKRVKDGDTVMVGGFLAGGHPEELVRALVETQSAGQLSLISTIPAPRNYRSISWSKAAGSSGSMPPISALTRKREDC